MKDRPVPRLIQQIFRKRVTGSLVITDDDGDVTRVYTRDGQPVHADRPNDIDRLDRILVGSGLVPDTVIMEANAEVNRSGRRLGDILVTRGMITREALAELLKTQMRRKLTRLFFVRQGSFDIFTEAHHYGAGDEFDLMRVDPRAILYSGIRAAYDDGRLREELKPLTGYSFRLVALPAGFLEAMGFASTDPVTAALREHAMTLDDLPSLRTKPNEARSAVLALLYADLLDARQVAAPARAPAAPAAPADATLTGPVITDAEHRRTTYTAIPAVTEVVGPTPTPRPAPATAPAKPAAAATTPAARQGGADALRATILDINTRMEQTSHFELLGVPETATNDDINAAYMRAVRQYHPDRLAAAGLREIAPVAERVMARMGEAVAVLTDKNRRSEYVARRSGGAGASGGAPSAFLIIEAEKSFQRGEVFMKKGDYLHALEAFAEAMRNNADEPHYRAYHAWARFEDPRARKELVAREVLGVLEAVIQDRPHFARGHYWLGQVRKHLNDMDHAERAFREAIKIDASLLEAERELRLLEMRKSKTPTRATGSPRARRKQQGLMKKLFNKD